MTPNLAGRVMETSKKAVGLVSSFCLLALAACSGGGGGSGAALNAGTGSTSGNTTGNTSGNTSGNTTTTPTVSIGAPDHPNVATVDFHMGELAMKRHHPEEAAAQFRRVLESWEKSLGHDHPSLSAPLDGLGDALMAQHKPGEAAEYYARALIILKKAVGPDHPDTLRTQNLLDQARKFR